MSEEIKVLFPEGVETLTISKNDYDRLYGQLTYENIVLQEKVEQLENIRKEAIKLIEEDILGKKIENVNWDYDECYYSDMPVERIKPLLNILNKGDNDEKK